MDTATVQLGQGKMQQHRHRNEARACLALCVIRIGADVNALPGPDASHRMKV